MRLSIVLLRWCWFRPLRGINHSRSKLLEADSSSLSLRLAPLSNRGFGSTAYTATRSVDYMSLMLFYMADSFHSARTPKLRLAHHKQTTSRAARAPSIYSVCLLTFAPRSEDGYCHFSVGKVLLQSSLLVCCHKVSLPGFRTPPGSDNPARCAAGDGCKRFR